MKELNYVDKEANTILELFTHPKVTDGIFILKHLTDKYPNHKIIFVVKKELVNMILLGEYFEKNFLCIEKDYSKDEKYISDTLTQYIQKYNKIVLAIFPEGTTFCKETIEKSNKWCDDNNIMRFKRVLCPRIRGYELIKRILKPQQIVNNIIYYEDDIDQTKTNYEEDLLKFDIVHKCKIISYSVESNVDINKLWRKNDMILELIYQKLNKHQYLN